MQTATVTTSPAVNNFLRGCITDAPPATLPKPSVPPPPNHRCPNCTSKLEPDEIKDGYCWTCLTPISSNTDTGFDE